MGNDLNNTLNEKHFTVHRVILICNLCKDNLSITSPLMSHVGSAGKGEQGMQNPGGQMDRPISFHFMERSVHVVYTFIWVSQYKVNNEKIVWAQTC